MGIDPRNKDEDSSAVARRRRKAKLTCKNISKKRSIEEMPEEITSGDPKPHITGIKNKTRYDPGVAMTRKELTAWRKEARRVRNRESAAESRRRTRDRIEELEEKLSSMEQKYSAALNRIAELESSQSSSGIQSHHVSQEHLGANGTESNATEPVPAPGVTTVVSPIISPVSSPKLSARTIDLKELHSNPFGEEVVNCQHINMISRPPA
mmetsp:Transcript_26511/g.40244  ORF Transcript_26511/g.40244 Transcript_26511/m.40244 type:complete len:209 (-) Transcript_26511:1033-1659(-)